MFRIILISAWVIAATVFAGFITQPIGVQGHFLLAISSLGGMLAISLIRLKGVWRHLFLALASIIALRYFYWRLTDTIPSPSNLLDFIPAILLISVEIYCFGMFALGLFVNAGPITRKAAPQLEPKDLPTVDVFVPSYNEERNLVAVTLAAAKAMDYPADKLCVYLLDDGGTDEKVYGADPVKSAQARKRRQTMQEMCAELGVFYLTRERNVHAKAGNLNMGLAHSSSDLVVVFDADHVPERDFLKETVGHFAEDEKLFLVQTPHFFINADPIERNLATFERMPSENEMFYGAIQKGLDSWNAAFFCGSAAILRRAALAEVGGFAGVSITEDCETALELHARGWKSLYVDKPLIAGLQPETFEAFIGQRSRWCSGMIQIFLLKNPLFKSGLSMAQRLCYTSSNIYWLFPLSRIAFLLAPLCFIYFNLQIYNTSPREFAAYTLTYIIAILLTQNYMYGRLRWPWISELYEYVQSVYLVRALVSTVLNPRAPKFNVTQKGAALGDDHLSGLAWPFYAIFAVLLATCGYSVHRYLTEPGARDLILVVGLWNLLNTVLAGLALGVISERRERRAVQRIGVNRQCQLTIGNHRTPVLVEDAAIGGVKLLPLDLPMQAINAGRQTATLEVPSQSDGETTYQVPLVLVSVTSSDGETVLRARFEGSRGDRFRAVVDLAYASLEGLRTIRGGRQRRRNIVASSAEMIVSSLRQTARGLFFAVFRRSVQTKAETVPQKAIFATAPDAARTLAQMQGRQNQRNRRRRTPAKTLPHNAA